MARRGERETIVEALGRSDLFLLPTGGENFGHAIFEALACGVPALISDQTPWRGLAAGRPAGTCRSPRRKHSSTRSNRSRRLRSQDPRAAWREGARACARAYVECERRGGGERAAAAARYGGARA